MGSAGEDSARSQGSEALGEHVEATGQHARLPETAPGADREARPDRGCRGPGTEETKRVDALVVRMDACPVGDDRHVDQEMCTASEWP